MFRDGPERVLVFRVGAERFAVRLAEVDEVMDAPAVRPLPDTRAPMLGIATLRGELVPVYDARPLLDLEDGAAETERSAMLLFARGAKRVGLAIDDVFDAITVESGDLRSAPGTEAADGILVGVVRRDRDLIGVLDAEALLDAAMAMTDGERS